MELKAAYIREKNSASFLIKLFNVHVPSGERGLREHRHSQFEIVLFKSGSGIYTTAGGEYEIHAGDVFVFSSNEQHCITKIDGGEPMVIMNLHFEPRYFWGSRFDGFSDGNMFFSHSDQFQNRLSHQNKSTDKIKRLMLEIEEEFADRKPEYYMMVRAKLTEIITLLVRDFDYCGETDEKKAVSVNIKTVRRAIDYVYKHLTEPITLKDISAAAGMSPSYFSSVFKTATGMTLWEYITQKRIELAMRIIDKGTSDTMLDIAAQCGFNTAANFNKAFKKCTGRTPKEYKSSGRASLY